ncbi:hypothetical protein ACNKHU_20945 [Shigella flexneri]
MPAAQVYSGKTVHQLTLNQMAVIAGLPERLPPLIRSTQWIAPSRGVTSYCRGCWMKGISPNNSSIRHARRRLTRNYHAPEIAFSAPYLSEMVRQEMYNRYGESAYEDGYRIYTTITRKVQQAAQQAVRNNVLDYDMRHGYRGPANARWKVASRRGIATRLPIR